MSINLTEREKQILELVREDNSLSVSAMSKSFGVSEVTIRSDLTSLAEKGFVLRTRGGAVPTFHPGILERQRESVEKKESIARVAAEMVSDGDHIMISAGTTTALVARYLLGKRDIHIVTNSTLLLPYIRMNPSVDVVFLGGKFTPSAEAMVGGVTLRELEQFHVKRAFLGTDGFSLQGGVTAHLGELAEVVRKMVKQADEATFLADSSKYGTVGFSRILPIDEVKQLVTDSEITDDACTELGNRGVTVTKS
ncbi:MAG: DeoR/GlpR transcriptional regulator [Kiritimatiellae bacterium]|nr:DeoR/GlpR transcriptional regulator [Kiritimatiellia bacterium]